MLLQQVQDNLKSPETEHDSKVRIMLQAILWLATEGDLAIANFDHNNNDREYDLFMQKMKMMALAMDDERESTKNWCLNAKQLRSRYLKSPLLRLK